VGRIKFWVLTALAVSFIFLSCAEKWSTEPNIPRITKEELRSLLGNPDVIIIDVRVEGAWKQSQWKIKGAVREDPEKDINTWANKYPEDKTLVFYCS
jgi:rhodanese-related sulfurtransferase